MPVSILIPGDAGKFKNYVRAVRAAGAVPCCGGDGAQCQGLLLPGGGDVEPWRYGQENTRSAGLDPQRDEEELALLDRFLHLGRPVLGVCRGMQVMNVYFGGDLHQDIPGHRGVPGGDVLHMAQMTPGLLRRLWGQTAQVNSCHHQAAHRLGRGLVPLAWAQDGTLEALGHKDLPALGVQWHPERMPLPPMPQAADGEKLFRAFVKAAAGQAPWGAGA